MSCSDRCLFAEVCSVPDGAVGCPFLPVPLCSHLALTCFGSLLSVPPRNSRSAEMAARSRMFEEAAALTHYSLTIRSLFAHYPLTIHSLLVLTALRGDSHSLFAHYPLIIRSLFTHYLLCSPSTDYSLTIHSPFDSQCEMHQSGARIRGFTIIPYYEYEYDKVTELHSCTSIKMNLLTRFQGLNYTPIRRGITT